MPGYLRKESSGGIREEDMLDVGKMLSKFKVHDQASREHYDAGNRPLPVRVDLIYAEYKRA